MAKEIIPLVKVDKKQVEAQAKALAHLLAVIPPERIKEVLEAATGLSVRQETIPTEKEIIKEIASRSRHKTK